MSSRNLFTGTLLLLLASMTMGCASSQPPSLDREQLQASLREPCPNLAPPTDGRRETMLKWSTNTAQAYRECQSRHRRTVEAWPK